MPTPKILRPAFLIGVPASVLLMAQATFGETAAEECKTRPDVTTPAGNHWYYRINRADKRHCWYLGAAAAAVHARGGGARSPGSTAIGAASPARDTENVPGAAATVASTAPVATAAEGTTGFSARWPDLPPSRELAETGVSNSYADSQTADVGQQAAAAFPTSIVPSAGETAALQTATPQTATAAVTVPLSLGGFFGMVFLVLLQWAFKFTRRHADTWRAMLRLEGYAGAPVAMLDEPPAPSGRRHQARRLRVPTDPAHDLKTSLRELMSDLRRAGEGCAPSQPAGLPLRAYAAADRHAFAECNGQSS
jgi:hypothetical protein